MNWFRVGSLWLVWLAVGAGYAYATEGEENPDKVETVVIPLDQIWALDMPGTRDVKTLDGSLVEEAQLAIGHSTPSNQETRPAFAVLGSGADALRAAHSVFTGKVFSKNIKRRKTFPEESSVSVVFFSAKSLADVHLDRVERQGNVVNIYYRFVANESILTTRPQKLVQSPPQFALIPLGKLSSGKYRVNVIESPPEQKLDGLMFPSSYEDTLRIVGNSFSFFVGQQPADQVPNEEGGEIYLDEIWGMQMPGTQNIGKLQWGTLPIQGDGGIFGQIRRSLSMIPPKGTEARAGFAVRDTGLEALREAHAVLAENKKPQETFRAGNEISVVFFSYQSGSYVHLHRIERQGNVVEIRYRFVWHETMEVTEHMAIIPLGKLPTGKYRVKIAQSDNIAQKRVALSTRLVREAGARRIVSNSFSFSVLEQ